MEPKCTNARYIFIETYCKTNNRPSTVREKRRALRRGLLQQLGHLKLASAGAREIEAFKARRKSDGVSNKTINEELAILSKLLGYAHEIGELERAPPTSRRLKVQPSSYDFFEFEEADRLLAAAKSAPDPWCAMIPVTVFTGLRLGELRGLQWDDVDLMGARIHIRRAADDTGALGPTKNGRARVVDLPRRAVEVLPPTGTFEGPSCSAVGTAECFSDGTASRSRRPSGMTRR